MLKMESAYDLRRKHIRKKEQEMKYQEVIADKALQALQALKQKHNEQNPVTTNVPRVNEKIPTYSELLDIIDKQNMLINKLIAREKLTLNKLDQVLEKRN